MAGWSLKDEAGNTYPFPSGFTLQGSVRVHTEAGTDTQSDLYWGKKVGKNYAVWNNDGDTAYLYNSGSVASQKSC